MAEEIEYQGVPQQRRPRRVPRKSKGWARVLEAMMEGRTLFIEDQYISDNSVKYLRLALSSRNAAKGEDRYRMHAEHGMHEGKRGRFIWAEPLKDPEYVPAVVIE